MSTRQVITRRQDALHLLPFSLLVGLILLLQAAFPTHVLASPKDQPPVQTSVLRSGVSVVRLVVSYRSSAARNTIPSMQCTGLGVVVASDPTSTNGSNSTPNAYKTWILTDGNLLNPNGAPSCLSSSSNTMLSGIDVYMSNGNSGYSATAIPSTGLSPIVDAAKTAQCLPTPTECAQEIAVFSLDSYTQPLPVISSASNASNSPSVNLSEQQVIALTNSSNSLPGEILASNNNPAKSTQYNMSLQSYLSPNELTVPDTTSGTVGNQADSTPVATTAPTPASALDLEAGTPLVDSNGYFSGMRLKNGTSLPYSTIESTISNARLGISAANSTNPVESNWQSGINAYNQHSFTRAQTDFQNAFNANHSFLRAQQMAALSAQMSANSGTAQRGLGPQKLDSISPFAYIRQNWRPALVALAILLILVLLAFFLTRSRIKRRHALRVEMAEANKQASLEASRIRQMEEAQASPNVHVDTGHLPVSKSTGSLPQQSPVMQSCPHCHQLVTVGSTYCPSCRAPLSPSESGHHLRMPVGQSAFPTAQPVPVSSLPPMPQLQSTPASTRIAADQPTMVPPPPLSIAEQPTREIGQQEQKPDDEDGEKTVPFALRQVNKQHFGLLVGTHTDPGIKRKYKPNEDSLFAAQGLLSPSQRPQNFGLFVIADGMGGHANGKDASRLAIQTIIDHLLPELSQLNEPMPDQRYAQLLASGIQQANLAVHDHNMQQRADMGTTVTAALVIDAIAYVSNVGDSRTYLYRPGIGLRKVTNDHSVVASLVEAGIIQPDDIYTHPKRNQIYRSLGEKPDVEIDSFTVQLQMGDKLLLCSDGLWDMVRDPKIESLVSTPDPNPDKTGEALIQAALEGGGEDNVSVIVVHVTDSGTGAHTATMSRIQLLAKPETVQMPQLS